MQDLTKLLKCLFCREPFCNRQGNEQDVTKSLCLPLTGLVAACAGGRCGAVGLTGDGRVLMLLGAGCAERGSLGHVLGVVVGSLCLLPGGNGKSCCCLY